MVTTNNGIAEAEMANDLYSFDLQHDFLANESNPWANPSMSTTGNALDPEQLQLAHLILSTSPWLIGIVPNGDASVPAVTANSTAAKSYALNNCNTSSPSNPTTDIVLDANCGIATPALGANSILGLDPALSMIAPGAYQFYMPVSGDLDFHTTPINNQNINGMFAMPSNGNYQSQLHRWAVAKRKPSKATKTVPHPKSIWDTRWHNQQASKYSSTYNYGKKLEDTVDLRGVLVNNLTASNSTRATTTVPPVMTKDTRVRKLNYLYAAPDQPIYTFYPLARRFYTIFGKRPRWRYSYMNRPTRYPRYLPNLDYPMWLWYLARILAITLQVVLVLSIFLVLLPLMLMDHLADIYQYLFGRDWYY